MSYRVTAKIDQIVTREVELLIEAPSETDAQEKAREALQDYPGEVSVEGVSRILVKNQTYWIPKSIDFPKTVKART